MINVPITAPRTNSRSIPKYCRLFCSRGRSFSVQKWFRYSEAVRRFPVHMVEEKGVPNTLRKLSAWIAQVKDTRILAQMLQILLLGIQLTRNRSAISSRRL